MFPSPAMRVWSSRTPLMGARAPASNRASAAASSAASGSRPSAASSGRASSGAPVDARPKRSGSTNRSSRSPSSANATCVCAARGDAAGSTRRRPDIPRSTTTPAPASNSSSRYLPLRRTARMGRPAVTRRTPPRSTARPRCSPRPLPHTVLTVAPTTAAARSRAIVSTSGSSGMGAVCFLALGFLAAHDGQVQTDLHGQRLAVDHHGRLAVVVPSERAGRELALVGDDLGRADRDLHGLCLLEELGLGDGSWCLCLVRSLSRWLCFCLAAVL